jgi:hypothetical protein
MAKVQELGMNLNPSRLPKKSVVESKDAEVITNKIHAEIEKKQAIIEEEVVAVKKTSFDFPVPLYKAMKRKLVDEEVSMRDYVIGLIAKDLGL